MIVKKESGYNRDILFMCLLFKSLSVTFLFLLCYNLFIMAYIIPAVSFFFPCMSGRVVLCAVHCRKLADVTHRRI
jgi:hypothetical protein